MTINKYDLHIIEKIVGTLLNWSGVTEDSPDETEILAAPNGGAITLGDIRDATVALDYLKTLAAR